ncbi:BgTH12-04239 [Blumeria graminis f. sp. triticale]|uniref:BgTH12-04239 n=1 Tax=Blumeria graminis f. sp. triticale TaxID=1689686 RepID=A0A9W4GCX5_BLUGR|nr:BgTH12-04239 [Blumeria graminis f. sp. triticale]
MEAEKFDSDFSNRVKLVCNSHLGPLLSPSPATRGEGNYASSECLSDRNQGIDQGLTHSQKVTSVDPWKYLHGPTSLDEELDALLGPVKFDLNDKTNAISRDSWVEGLTADAYQPAAPSCKRRKFKPDQAQSSSIEESSYEVDVDNVFLPPHGSKLLSPITTPTCRSPGDSSYGLSMSELYKQKNIISAVPAEGDLLERDIHNSVLSYDPQGASKLQSVYEKLPSPNQNQPSEELEKAQPRRSHQPYNFIPMDPDEPIPSTEESSSNINETRAFQMIRNKKVPDWLLEQSEKRPRNAISNQEQTNQIDQSIILSDNTKQKNMTKDSPPQRQARENTNCLLTSRESTFIQQATNEARRNELHRKITTFFPMACSLEIAGSNKDTILTLIAELITYDDYQDSAPNYQIPSSYRQILDELTCQWSTGTEKNEFRKALIAYVKEKMELELTKARQVEPSYMEGINDGDHQWIDEVGVLDDKSKKRLRDILSQSRERIAYLSNLNLHLQDENEKLRANLERVSTESYLQIEGFDDNSIMGNTETISQLLSLSQDCPIPGLEENSHDEETRHAPIE